MPIHVVKETIELDEVTLDANGNAFIQKRINLEGGYVHNMLQTDIFQDAMLTEPSGTEATPPIMEIVISPYPQIPTSMNLSTQAPVYGNRYAAAGDDSVLFKAVSEIRSFTFVDFLQFPSTDRSLSDLLLPNPVYCNLRKEKCYPNLLVSC